MKSTRRYGWTFLSLIFMMSCFLFACKRDSSTTPTATADGAISSIVDPCSTCSNENMYKTVGNNNEVLGTIAICQTLTDLTITFAVSGTDAHFSKTAYGIYAIPPSELNPSPALLNEVTEHEGTMRTFSYTIPLSSLGDPLTLAGTTFYIATNAVIPAGGGGMVWAGNLITEARNPNSRYFSYEIKACETPEPPTAGCFFSQGYWFAKPNGSQWLPVTEMDFGGQLYSYSDARAIFFSSNAKTGKTDAKQAFLQGLAYKLSRENGANGAGVSACDGADEALARIEAYFAANAKEQTAQSINKYAANYSLRADASLLSSCIGAHHCNSIADDTASK